MIGGLYIGIIKELLETKMAIYRSNEICQTVTLNMKTALASQGELSNVSINIILNMPIYQLL